MKKLGLNEIREKFKNFYVEKGHYPAPSASLIPKNDKSLLIINSGMAPLKAYFLGQENPPAKRMTTCQKCIRTGDIENVGLHQDTEPSLKCWATFLLEIILRKSHLPGDGNF